MESSEWVEPGVKLEPACVRRVDGESEWVVSRLGREPLLASEILGPRLVRRPVKCIGGRADVKNHRVELEREGSIEDGE
jgi:hypothetical protein